MQKVDKKGLGNQIPPDLFHVEIYFEANGSTMASAQQFYDYYKGSNWRNYKNDLIENWKVLAWQWIYYR